MDKEDMVYIYNGIYLSHKKEAKKDEKQKNKSKQNKNKQTKETKNAICSSMDGPRGFLKN